MEQLTDSLINMLIINDSLHETEQIVSVLRSFSLHVKAEFAQDSDDMRKLVATKHFELVLFSLDVTGFTIQQAQAIIKEHDKHIPLIAMTVNSIRDNIIECMDNGAQDLVNPLNREHIAKVIKRENLQLSTWRYATKIEAELKESEKRCQSLLANSKDAIAYVHEGMHIYANDAYLELYGFEHFDDIEGLPIMDLTHADNKQDLKELLRKISTSDIVENSINVQLLHSSGDYLKGDIEFTRASYNNEPCIQVLIRSQADTSELEAQIDYLHNHDVTTGLFNRQYFMDELKLSLEKAKEESTKSAVLYISIDDFPAIKKSLGISGVDVLISDLAKLIKNIGADNNMFARFGNTSFTSICFSDDSAFIEKTAKSIKKVIEKNISDVNNKSISATASISICYIDENSPPNANEIIARCEKTIRELQKDGGNDIKVFIPTVAEMSKSEEDGQINLMIKSALKRKKIYLLFQPIVGLASNSGACYSTSIAIKDENKVKHHQHAFMESAERTGIVKTIDRWVIMNSISRIATSNDKELKLCIKLSLDSVIDPSLVIWIGDCINTARIPGSSLIFIINESTAVNQLKATKVLYDGIKKLGCLFALDEFGMGTNPFQLIKHVKADLLRLNVGFMEQLSQNQDNKDSIQELADLATSMDIKIIAPNVDDASTLTVLWSLGAHFVQGDFLQPIVAKMNYDFSSIGM